MYAGNAAVLGPAHMGYSFSHYYGIKRSQALSLQHIHRMLKKSFSLSCKVSQDCLHTAPTFDITCKHRRGQAVMTMATSTMLAKMGGQIICLK